MVYAAVKSGKTVNWIIRGSGEGPGIFRNSEATGRYRNDAEVRATQKATLLNPSGIRTLSSDAQVMHQSLEQREILNQKLFASDIRYKAWANYSGREKALPCFRELEPTSSYVLITLSGFSFSTHANYG